MSSSPRLIIHGIAATPKSLSKHLQYVTKREKKPLSVSSDPIEIIDLTLSPMTLETSPTIETPHNQSYNLFVSDLNTTTYDVRNRRLHPNWKCSQAKKKYDLLTDIYNSGSLRSVYSGSNDQRFMTPRTPNVQKYSPKQLLKSSPNKSTLEDSPYTPKNQVELRPMRGYRLQDVLHRRPITPVNYYKNSVMYVRD